MNTRIIALVRVITEMDILGRGLTNVISVYTYLFSYARCKGTMKYEIIVAARLWFNLYRFCSEKKEKDTG